MTTTPNLGLTKPSASDSLATWLPTYTGNLDILDDLSAGGFPRDLGVNILTIDPTAGTGGDDTQAFLDSIDEAYTGGGSLYLPYPASGEYNISTTIDLSDYSFLHVIGGSFGPELQGQPGKGVFAGQFPPGVRINGTDIAAGPTFYCDRGGSGASHKWENLAVYGGLNAWHYREAANVKFTNCAGFATTVADEDNCAVLVENSFWFWYEDCGWSAPSTSKPAIILRGRETHINASASGLQRFKDCTFWSGGVLHDQRDDPTGAGNLSFTNCLMENSAGQAMLTITETAGVTTTYHMYAVSFRSCEISDSGVSDIPIVELDSSHCELDAPTFASCLAPESEAVKVLDGHVYGARITGALGSAAARYIKDVGGNLRGNYVSDKYNGVDFIGDEYDANATTNNTLTTHNGAPIRLGQSAETRARFGLDHRGVMYWGDGASAYDTTLYRSAADTLKTDDSFAVGSSLALSPTGYVEGTEISDPSAPASNKGRWYFKDNGSGKTQLVVRFPTGAVQVIATEP